MHSRGCDAARRPTCIARSADNFQPFANARIRSDFLVVGVVCFSTMGKVNKLGRMGVLVHIHAFHWWSEQWPSEPEISYWVCTLIFLHPEHSRHVGDSVLAHVWTLAGLDNMSYTACFFLNHLLLRPALQLQVLQSLRNPVEIWYRHCQIVHVSPYGSLM